MLRFSIQLLILFFVVSFCVFFGVELAKEGIEEIHGPLEANSESVPTTVEVQPQDEEVSVEKKDDSNKLDLNKPIPEPTGVGVKIGDVLQSTAHKSVEIIVSIFNAVFS
ncbi:DUF3679 domain-containing protein [Chengkuizengella axinellae]|uniref:DUF3679 domain-containing protein n=1 Tax=Chengkuizengella axinellae TaxID=3064388 RepID=A0ABT9IW66_9BACL|nr:DUF3679 domain-containing protein [Chengkuizengella sp. 2205SS18-9]MDP5273059.1 DUF3679 domain-containing protein [Chengkuizengella sp. 2205SS18-9]